MKSLADYNVADWLRLRPLTHGLKMVRYRAVDRRYARLLPREGDPVALRTAVRGQRLLVTVAYSDPQAIDWQARLIKRYLPNARYLIADNSPDEESAAAIQAIATAESLLYVRLPRNPWHAGSRSHGIALNWLWRNIIRPGEPERFGLLDDDMFPTRPDDPFAILDSQDYYGVVREAGLRWFLWAGFCFYRFDRVKNIPLDFGQDWFNGLDTGGGNWRSLYCKVDRSSLREADTEFVAFKPGIGVQEGPFQWCGSWLHEVGQMGDENLTREKRRVLGEILKPHLRPESS